MKRLAAQVGVVCGRRNFAQRLAGNFLHYLRIVYGSETMLLGHGFAP
jgi:hypothetical protein